MTASSPSSISGRSVQEAEVPVELHFAVVYELRDGRVVRLRNYLDPADALEAVGLPE